MLLQRCHDLAVMLFAQFALEGIRWAFSPRFRAVAIPGASGLFEMTTAIRASGIRPASMLSAIATKFDPRPERRIPRDFKRMHENSRL